MRGLFQRVALAVLVGPVLCLPGCATGSPEPAVQTVAAAGPFIHLSPPPLRPKRTDPCKLAKADLSLERKQALFKQFASESETDLSLDQPTVPPTLAATVPAPAPASSTECRHAAR